MQCRINAKTGYCIALYLIALSCDRCHASPLGPQDVASPRFVVVFYENFV